jgi:hypothetical protein
MALLDLSFSSGHWIPAEIRQKLRLPISHSAPSPDLFSLVVAFVHCKFYLSLQFVGSLLQATIGGDAAHFRVSRIENRVFRFLVSSKPIGLFISKLDCLLLSVTCSSSPFTFGVMVALIEAMSLTFFR